DWKATINGAFTYYPFAGTGITSSVEMINKYGLLYNAYTVLDAREIAPEGWKIPSNEDWKELERYMGMSELEVNGSAWRGTNAYVFKTTTGWSSNNGTNGYGFSALPAGCRAEAGAYSYLGERANFWTTTSSATPTGRNIRRI